MVRAIPSIKGELSFEEFALATGLGRNMCMELIRFLAKNEMGVIDSNSIKFTDFDRMRLAILAIQHGADIEDVSEMLNWRDFEVLSAHILESHGYMAYHALRLKKPRAEIDVVGMKDGLAVLVDCKHWKRNGNSELKRFAMMQVKRARAFAKLNKDVRISIPVILTLHTGSITFADEVPVIPILKFRSFLNEIHGYLDEVRLQDHESKSIAT
jgi:hypothetical protein